MAAPSFVLLMVAVDDRTARWGAGLDGHAEGVGDQRCCRRGVDGPADHPAGEAVQDDRAVSLPSRVGCSVMSVTYNWFGPGRENCRSTRSAAT
jgi:hypothetical protein